MKNKHIHDCGYKNFFSNPVTVKQLLTSFVNEDWVYNLDFNTLERKVWTWEVRRYPRPL